MSIGDKTNNSKYTDEEIRAEGQVHTFESISQWEMVGKGQVYTVRCPFTCYEFKWLLNQTATIDNKEWKIIDVETFVKTRPISRGQVIGLLVQSMNYKNMNY